MNNVDVIHVYIAALHYPTISNITLLYNFLHLLILLTQVRVVFT